MSLTKRLPEVSEQAISAAGEAGYEAGVSGGRYSANPYDRLTDSERYDAWGAGWEQGAQVREEAGA